MNQKKYKNSILIEGDYSFNYLTNLLYLCERCLSRAVEKNDFDLKKNKKMLKNINNLCSFFESSVNIFSKLSKQNNEDKIIIHNVEYDENNTKIQVDLLTDKLSDDVIKKNKEVDNKYNEEN